MTYLLPLVKWPIDIHDDTLCRIVCGGGSSLSFHLPDTELY